MLSRTWSDRRVANNCVERMGTSRSDHLQFVRQRRLVPTAHARRWANARAMKTFIILMLLCVSALGAETDIHVFTLTKTNAEARWFSTRDVFTRDGQTNLIRFTNVTKGQVWWVHHFYHAGQLVANFVADSTSSRFNTEVSPYCVSLSYSESGRIKSAAIGTKEGVYLDEFSYSNNVFAPVPGPIVRDGGMKPKFADWADFPKRKAN